MIALFSFVAMSALLLFLTMLDLFSPKPKYDDQSAKLADKLTNHFD